MKLEMRDTIHGWITFGEMSDANGQCEAVIIDRKRKDVRVQLHNDILKIQYDQKGVKAVLLNDIYVWQRSTS